MPQTRQHIYGERPPHQWRMSEGAVMAEEGMQRFLSAYERMNHREGTGQFYRRKLRRFYDDLPADKTIQHSTKVYLLIKLFASTGLFAQELPEVTVEAVTQGRIVCAQNKYKQIVTIPGCLRKELLDYARKGGIGSGPIFRTRDGRPMHRTYVSAAIRSLCEEAKVSGEKGNPKCLRKLYLSTKAGVESNIALLVEQAMERILEQEQFSIGWEE